MPPITLSDLIGKEITVLIPRLHAPTYRRIKLLGVEAGGIWVESSQEIMNAALQATGLPAAPNTLVVFWPYHEIAFVIGSIERTSLNEKAFGV